MSEPYADSPEVRAKTLVDEFCSDPQRHIKFLQAQVASQAERIRELEEENKNLQGLLVKRTRLADLYRTRFNQQQEGGGE